MIKFNRATKACSALLLWAAAAIALPAQTLTTLFSFNGNDGVYPFAGLVQGTDGNLYGTTSEGARGGCGSVSCGTIFKITVSGTLTTLHTFSGPDGSNPYAGLVQGTDGNLYGTTLFGGANSCEGFGCGTIFKITPSGTLTALHSFNGNDGEGPEAGLVQATNGSFYGTTYAGGAKGDGTVFKITPGGTLTTLHSFDETDGQYPYAGLVQATDGDLYGTTEDGGANSCEGFGCGTVFKITPSGTLTTLHSFDGADGTFAIAGLVQGTDGDLYGTTFEGGANSCGGSSCGTVFKITRSGTLTTLHRFDGADGERPYAGLVPGTDGNFYGTTVEGGGNGRGTVFKIVPSGTLTTLYNFCSQRRCADGANPEAGLIQGTNGIFYGTTYAGAANHYGTVFGLSVGLKPFVETQPTSGAVGAAVNILGTNLTGATGVTFNGTAAVFAVVSHSLITTTVPAGATTGKVQVSGPGGTGVSNVPFLVRP